MLTVNTKEQFEFENILDLRNNAYESGYYAGVLQHAHLTESERNKYLELHTRAVEQRRAAEKVLGLT